jgi:Mg-chelatase subunit ChlI
MKGLIHVLDGRMDVETIRSRKNKSEKNKRNRANNASADNVVVSSPKTDKASQNKVDKTNSNAQNKKNSKEGETEQHEVEGSENKDHESGVITSSGEFVPFKPLCKRYCMSPAAAEV